MDWAAVGLRRRRMEWVCKPAVMVFLAAAAVLLRPESGAQRWWFVAALVFSLAGDVFLMFTPERDWFVFGLGSFLVAHLCFVVGLALEPGGLSAVRFVVGAVVLVGVGAVVGGRVLAGVGRSRLRAPVALYMTAISAMVAMAAASGDWRAIAGAGLFYGSDACIAWNKFVKPFDAAKLVIIVTYHVAQFLLVWSLT